MDNYEDNIPLTKEEIEKIKNILNTVKFEDIKFHDYFSRPALSGDYSEDSRHGITKKELKNLVIDTF